MKTHFQKTTPGLAGRFQLGLATVGLAAGQLWMTPTCRADQTRPPLTHASELFPATTVLFAESMQWTDVVAMAMDHPLTERLTALPAYQALQQDGGLQPLRQGVAGFEAAMQMPWLDAIKTATDRGISVGVDASGAVGVLIRSSDPVVLERLRGFLLAAAQIRSGKWLARRDLYRDQDAYALSPQWKMAQLDDWLVLTNNGGWGESVIDEYLDRRGGTLATVARYQASIVQEPPTAAAGKLRLLTGYVDVEMFRGAGIPKNFFRDRSDNLAIELIAGGVLQSLRNSPLATVAVDVDAQGVDLRIRSPHDRQWQTPREFYFAETNAEDASVAPDVADTLFSLSTHRDLSQMWLRAGDLLTEKGLDQVETADSQLTTFFAGRDFGEDILGGLHHDIQVVGRVVDRTDRRPRPAIQLPAVAMQFRMRTPERTGPELRRVFQSFVGFFNVTGATNGNPQWDLGLESVATPNGPAQLVTATVLPQPDEIDSVNAALPFNFSPTIAFAGQRVILSSTTELAREMVTASSDRTGDPTGIPATSANTSVVVHAAAVRSLLDANRESLIAGSMLEKGHSRDAAQAEIDLLLELVGMLDRATLDLKVTDERMELSAGLRVP